MAPIRIKHVVSFSSQDPKSRVDNVCESSGAGRPWLCAALDRSGVLKAELQLERASTIGFIDVGNLGSAFIQVDVGRSSWPSNHPYVPLLPTATLMSPADSRQGKGRQGVRMFKKADFLPQAAKESWDRLRLTCTQPFNKKSQFGLSFLRLRTAEEQTEEVSADQEHTTAENQITPNKMISVREWLTSPALQHTFFGQKTEEVSPGEAQKNHVLSRAERMVTAVQSVRRSLSIVPHNTLTSSPCQSEAKSPNSVSDAHSSGFISSGSKASTPVDRRRRSKTSFRQEQTSMASTPKRSRSAGCEKLASKCSQTSTPTRAATKKNIKTLKRCQSPVKTNTPAASPTQNIPHSPEPPESACPICGVSFSPLYLPFHASSCLDSGPVGFSGDMDSDILTSFPSPTSFGISRDEHMVPCPLCSLSLPIDCIEQHASTCGDTVWVD